MPFKLSNESFATTSPTDSMHFPYSSPVVTISSGVLGVAEVQLTEGFVREA
jgi:hypothetical protein